MEYDISHLKDYQEQCDGPVQSDEALCLYSLIKVMRPNIIVEFGFFKGHSAVNFINAMTEDCKLYSFDCWDQAEEAARAISDNRFKFIHKKQENFDLKDIDNNMIDFLFIDASHHLETNIKTFKKIGKSLNGNAIIAIHDTGTWNINHRAQSFRRYHESTNCGHYLNDKEFIHQPDERRFVNYLKSYHPEFNQIHLHSLNTFRHGITILQKSGYLDLGKMGLRDHVKLFLRIHLSWLLFAAQRIRIYLKERRLPDIKSVIRNKRRTKDEL